MIKKVFAVSIMLISLLLLPVFANDHVGDGGWLAVEDLTIQMEQRFYGWDPDKVDKIVIINVTGHILKTLGSEGGKVSGLRDSDYPLTVLVYDDVQDPLRREINEFKNVGKLGAIYAPPDLEYLDVPLNKAPCWANPFPPFLSRLRCFVV